MFGGSRIGGVLSLTTSVLFGKRMIIAKSQKELDKMRAVGELIASVRESLREMVKPGVTTLELNTVAEKMMRDAGAIPTFIGYKPHGMVPFPFAICASANDQIVHGFSNDTPLKEGDIISLDMACTLDGFVGDTAATVPVGEVSDELKQLIRVTEECLALGIAQCRPNNRIGDIGAAIQAVVEASGFSIVRDLVGHGIGVAFHEEPQVPNYGKPKRGTKLVPGLTIAIEPMVNIGGPATRTMPDRWTVVTIDGSRSAHFEHTVAITESGPRVLTSP